MKIYLKQFRLNWYYVNVHCYRNIKTKYFNMYSLNLCQQLKYSFYSNVIQNNHLIKIHVQCTCNRRIQKLWLIFFKLVYSVEKQVPFPLITVMVEWCFSKAKGKFCIDLLAFFVYPLRTSKQVLPVIYKGLVVL